MYAYVGIDIN
nr:Chain A, Anti-sigma factor [Acetivibrio thermocellus DSM 1313]